MFFVIPDRWLSGNPVIIAYRRVASRTKLPYLKNFNDMSSAAASNADGQRGKGPMSGGLFWKLRWADNGGCRRAGINALSEGLRPQGRLIASIVFPGRIRYRHPVDDVGIAAVEIECCRICGSGCGMARYELQLLVIDKDVQCVV